jgi:hypothetical protein
MGGMEGLGREARRSIVSFLFLRGLLTANEGPTTGGDLMVTDLLDLHCILAGRRANKYLPACQIAPHNLKLGPYTVHSVFIAIA